MGSILDVPGGTVFVAALVLMILIGIVQAIGLGGDFALDGDADMGGDWLGWLGVGRLPLLMLLVVFLALFGLLGMAGQQGAVALAGRPLGGPVAIGAAAVLALPLTGIVSRLLEPVMPRDETSAIDLADLVGREAVITVGRAARGSPARARVVDRHGQAHHVMVEPIDASAQFAEGHRVQLVRYGHHQFLAIGRGDALLPRLD